MFELALRWFIYYADKKPTKYRAFFVHKTMYLLSYAWFD